MDFFIILLLLIFSGFIGISALKVRNKVKRTRFIDNLPNNIIKDWSANTSSYKISTYNSDDIIAVYRFNNGDKISLFKILDKKVIVYDKKRGRTTNHVIYSWDWNEIISVLNKVLDKANGGSKYRTSNSKPKPKKTNPNHSHPKWDRYWSLILTIRQRTTNLENYPKGHPDRPSRVNELNSAKRRAKAMKERYNF